LFVSEDIPRGVFCVVEGTRLIAAGFGSRRAKKFSEKARRTRFLMWDVENSGNISQKLHMIVDICEKMLTMALAQKCQSNAIEDDTIRTNRYTVE
jgi:hypothetical protein